MLIWSVCNIELEETTNCVSEDLLCLYGLCVIQCLGILLILSLRSHCPLIVCLYYSVGRYYSSFPWGHIVLIWSVIQCWRKVLILSLRSHCAGMVYLYYSVEGYYSFCPFGLSSYNLYLIQYRNVTVQIALQLLHFSCVCYLYSVKPCLYYYWSSHCAHIVYLQYSEGILLITLSCAVSFFLYELFI